MWIRILVLATILFGSRMALHAQNLIPLTSDTSIDTAVTQIQQQQGIVGVGVVVVYDGEIVYLKGYGSEDLEANIPVSPTQTRFRWASISKTLTAALAVRAAEAGVLQLNKHVSKYYPSYEVPDLCYDGGVTTRLKVLPPSQRYMDLNQILSHMAGIQSYSNGLADPTPPASELSDPSINTGMEWALKYWTSNPLVDIPGQRETYSTLACNLAGVVLEQKLGRHFDDLVQMQIASVAGMTTLRPDTTWNPAPRRAVGYIVSPTALPIRDNKDEDVSWKLAGGGYLSTVQDLGKYAIAMLGNDLLTESEKEIMWTPQKFNDGQPGRIGLGWFLNSVEYGHRDFRASHSGDGDKAQCRLMLYPKRNLAIGVMTNSSNACNVGGLSTAIANVVLGRVRIGDSPVQTGADMIMSVATAVAPPVGYAEIVVSKTKSVLESTPEVEYLWSLVEWALDLPTKDGR